MRWFLGEALRQPVELLFHGHQSSLGINASPICVHEQVLGSSNTFLVALPAQKRLNARDVLEERQEVLPRILHRPCYRIIGALAFRKALFRVRTLARAALRLPICEVSVALLLHR